MNESSKENTVPSAAGTAIAPSADERKWATFAHLRRLPYRRGTLFEGMLPPTEASAVEAAKNAIPAVALGAARALAGAERDCPCAVSMERYRKRGVIGPDFRGWVAPPGRGKR